MNAFEVGRRLELRVGSDSFEGSSKGSGVACSTHVSKVSYQVENMLSEFVGVNISSHRESTWRNWQDHSKGKPF